MRLLITRPEEDSKALALALRAKGIEILIEPLLSIRPIDAPPIDLAGVQAILITSANGLRALARRTPRRDIGVLAVGEGSAQAAKAAGFAAVESASGDVGALVDLAKRRLDPKKGALYHPAGSDLAGDLAGELEKAGYTVRRQQLYEAVPASAFSPGVLAELSQGGIDGVMLFSPRTAGVFGDLWRRAGEPALTKVVGLCLSQAVADRIGAMGWREIEIARTPDLPSMLALVDAERERMSSMSDSSSQPAEEAGSDPIADNAAPPAEAGEPEVKSAAPERSGGGWARFLGPLLAGAIGGAAITLASPYWLGLIGGATREAPSEDRIAGLESALQQKAGTAEIAAATDPLRSQIEALNSELVAARNELSAQAASLQAMQAGATGLSNEGSALPATVDLAPVEERIGKLEATLGEVSALASRSAEAQAAPAQIAEAARQALEAENRALRDRIDELARKIEETAALSARLGEIETRLDQVPAETQRQRAAALIVAIGQLQSALADDRTFYAPLRTVQDLAIADQDIWDRLQPVIDVLAPLAEAGVPTRSQLAAGFPGTDIARAAEADLAGSLIEDAPWWKRLMHRLSEVVTVRPVGGDVEGDGPLERLARAEADLAEGDLSAAVAEVSGITGSAQEAAADWLSQANARIAVDEAASTLAGFSARALEPAPGGSG